MLIKDLKSYVLSITKEPFFLKFHMGNEETLKDLIERTKAWNTSRGIDNDDGALVFDIFLDRDYFDLYMEVDVDMEKENPINKDKEIKFLTVKKVKYSTSVSHLFTKIRE